MTKHSTRRLLLLGCAALLGAAGCGSQSYTERPATHPVSGQILLPNGEPLTEGVVTFSPQVLTNNEATGELGSGGRFHLSSFGNEDGAGPGVYKVSISPVSYKRTGNPVIVAQWQLIPRKYLDSKTSDLEIEVKEGDNELPPIRLK